MMGFGFTTSTQTSKNISNCLYPNILTHISIFKKAFSPDLGKNLVAYKLSSSCWIHTSFCTYRAVKTENVGCGTHSVAKSAKYPGHIENKKDWGLTDQSFGLFHCKTE